MTIMPGAFHSATNDLPYADDWADTPGVRLKLLMADIEGSRFAVRIGFAPGILLPPHQHTGEVHAYTLSGEWYYLEHTDDPPNRGGSYLFEPPGSTHTLKVSDNAGEETDVIFVVYGAMIHFGPEGEILAVGDAASHLRDWPAALRAQGKPVPEKMPIGGSMAYRHLPEALLPD
jgi:quercetin dioxygenase-like cupin family protein